MLERFRRLAVTDNGEPVDGVILSVNQEDVLLFNTEQVSLVQGLELADVLEGLERLQSELPRKLGVRTWRSVSKTPRTASTGSWANIGE